MIQPRDGGCCLAVWCRIVSETSQGEEGTDSVEGVGLLRYYLSYSSNWALGATALIASFFRVYYEVYEVYSPCPFSACCLSIAKC
jgi:hypothetical protein